MSRNLARFLAIFGAPSLVAAAVAPYFGGVWAGFYAVMTTLATLSVGIVETSRTDNDNCEMCAWTVGVFLGFLAGALFVMGLRP